MSGNLEEEPTPKNGVLVRTLRGISDRVSDLGKDVYETWAMTWAMSSIKEEEEEEGRKVSSFSAASREENLQSELQTAKSIFLPDEEGTQLFRNKALGALPVENAIFKQHTKCLGLLFKTLRVERMFLDGLAKLERNVVYLGYCLVTGVSFLSGLRGYIQMKYRETACPPQYYEFCGNDGTTDYFVQITYGYYFSTIFPTLLLFTLVGCSVHWYIHNSKRIKEKSWAMLSTGLLYMTLILASNITIISTLNQGWPDVVLNIALLTLTSFIFFSGMPSFSTFFFLWIINLLVCCIAYPITYQRVKDSYGAGSQELLLLTVLAGRTGYGLLIFTIISLCGAYLMEVADRKQFLQRMLANNQQEQIIREKTKNENLQRKLLENMLPKSIVDQLQQQNFTITSWDEHRALCHRHLGVSILFAELEHFTTFSSEVDPPRVMAYLNDLFLIFDNLCDQYEVYKVETVGDQYVAAVGVVTGDMLTEEAFSVEIENPLISEKSLDNLSLPQPISETSIKAASCSNTDTMIRFARAALGGSRHVVIPETSARPLLRVGIHTGPCMSGIVGTRNFRFCLFGDTMNTAARMEQHGVPECIHVSQDVVDLAPEHSWEKRKKLNVKGKGLMQTYLLHVTSDLDKKESLLISDESADHTVQRADAFHPLLFQQHDDVAIDAIDADESPRSGYQDVMPVEAKVYAEHTVCLGLFFKKQNIERAYLDHQARLHETIVYLGYLLYLLVLLTNLLYGYISYLLQDSICANSEYKEFCLVNFGVGAYEAAQDSDPTIGYNEIISYSIFRMTPTSAGILLALNGLGCASHWLVHKSTRIVDKYWALLNVSLFYFLKLITINVIIMIYARQSDETSAQWPWSLGPMVVIQSTLFIFFSGATFTLNLLWWIIATGLFYGLTIPVVLEDQNNLETGMGVPYTTILITENYIATAFLIFWYGIILLIGSYFKDVTSRKRFLQRVLIIQQQDSIIQTKTRNENIQKAFLETILPSSLVGELQMQETEMKEDDRLSRKSFLRLQSLTKTHVGVSMLYADLVGFTAFSAQVDPFKVMVFLNDLFHVFDNMCDEYNVYKLETVGDCYVATVGVVTGELVSMAMDSCTNTLTDSMEEEISASNSKDLVGFAKAMIRASRGILKPEVDTPATMRIGIHVGPCMSGIIGTKKFKFCLLGDTVVKAAHMEKWGTPDCIHCSQEIVDLVPDESWEQVLNLKHSHHHDPHHQEGHLKEKTYLLRV